MERCSERWPYFFFRFVGPIPNWTAKKYDKSYLELWWGRWLTTEASWKRKLTVPIYSVPFHYFNQKINPCRHSIVQESFEWGWNLPRAWNLVGTFQRNLSSLLSFIWLYFKKRDEVVHDMNFIHGFRCIWGGWKKIISLMHRQSDLILFEANPWFVSYYI